MGKWNFNHTVYSIRYALIGMSFFVAGHLIAQSSFQQYNLNPGGKGQKIKILVEKGKDYGHPVLAIWLANTDGTYIQTLFVSKTVATGIYPHGKVEGGKWYEGERRNASTLPYWAHNRGIKASDSLYLPTPQNPVPDAYTGATPKESFVIEVYTDTVIHGKAMLLLEINKPFDFNDFWHNALFPDNASYKNSGQPSIVYAVTIYFDNPDNPYFLNPIGHGHPCGENGKLFTDISSLTSALKIIARARVEVFQKTTQ